MILLFEEKAKPKALPAGIAKKMSLADLGIRPDMAQHLGWVIVWRELFSAQGYVWKQGILL